LRFVSFIGFLCLSFEFWGTQDFFGLAPGVNLLFWTPQMLGGEVEAAPTLRFGTVTKAQGDDKFCPEKSKPFFTVHYFLP
jgi:hypothetical protein